MPRFVRTDRPIDGVARVTLDRPDKKNALSIAVRDEISDTLDELSDDESVRVVVIASEGDVFCAGFDLAEFDRAFADETIAEQLWASSDRYHRRVASVPIPTVAAVNGPAIAGGFDLAVMCDFRVAAATATFSHPEYTFGDVVYSPLRDLVGGAWARGRTSSEPRPRQRAEVRHTMAERSISDTRAGGATARRPGHPPLTLTAQPQTEQQYT